MRLLLTALVLFAAGCLPKLPTVQNPCAGYGKAGLYRVDVPGYDRKPVVYVPAQGGPKSAVVVLHGAGGSGQAMRDQVTTYYPRAQREGFVVAFPDGTGDPRGYTWNAGGCCGLAQRMGTDDVGYLDALADTLRERTCADFVLGTGHSNGGMMVYRQLCQANSFDAALISAGTKVSGARCDGPPVPVMAVHGGADPRIPYGGGQNMKGRAFPSVEESFAALRKKNRCSDAPPRKTTQGPAVCRTWDCDVPTTLCVVDKWGHGWFGQKLPGFASEVEGLKLLEQTREAKPARKRR